MTEKKIYIDSLPCKSALTTPLLLICVISSIAEGVSSFMGRISGTDLNTIDSFTYIPSYIAFTSSALWLIFFGLFANGCRKLPHVSAATMLLALTGFAQNICGSLFLINKSVVFLIINVCLMFVSLAAIFWLGTILQKNYSSYLGDMGKALKKLFKLSIFLYILTVILVFISQLDSIWGAILIFCIGIANGFLGLWYLWIGWDDFILPMYHLLNWGHQESITQKDIEILANKTQKVS